MKLPILPILCAGFVASSAAPVHAQTNAARIQVQQRQQEEVRTQQPTEVQEQGATAFELRQEQRPAQTVERRTSATATATTQRTPETSAEAAALSENAQVISLRETPPAVRRHIERQAAFVPLQRIVKQMQGDQAVYEATFEGASVATKLLLAENGKPLNLHVTAATPVIYEAAGAQRPGEPHAGQMPKATMDRLRQQIGSAQIQSVQPRTVYEVNVMQGGQAQQIWVYEDGTVLR